MFFFDSGSYLLVRHFPPVLAMYNTVCPDFEPVPKGGKSQLVLN